MTKKDLIFQIILLILFINNSIFSIPTDKNQPEWNQSLDLNYIEKQLYDLKIIELTNMREYLHSKGKIARYTNEVYLATMENGLLAVFKPEENLYDSFGEIAAYKASKTLGFKLVPPTIIKMHDGRVGSLQFFIKSHFDLLKPEENKKARSFLSKEDISAMYLFYFIFGQWDTHPGNQMVAFDEKENKSYIALIDNAAIINQIQIKYGDYAFVKRLHQDGISSNYDELFPFLESKILKLPTTIEEVKKQTKFDIAKNIINNWNNYGINKLTYIIWQDGFWIQFYKKNKTIAPNFTDYYPKEILDTFKKINKEFLEYIWQEAIEHLGRNKIQPLIDSTLERLEQVIKHANDNLN